jgi:RHS repeat-associated protein
MGNKNYLRTISIWMIVLIVSLPIIFAESLSYDQNGNLISGDGRYREYDDWNNLERIRDGNTVSDPVMEEYIYDEEGIRLLTIKYNSSGYITEKIYTPSREFSMVQNLSGRFNFTYIYSEGTLIARNDSFGNVLYYHSDHLGSTNLITNSSGDVVEKTFHTPFGEVDGENPTVETKVGYTGHELDEGTGLVYMKARYYNPQTKQFISPDTLLPDVYDPQSLNRYSYVLNNPYRYIDPEGMEPTQSEAGDPEEVISFIVYAETVAEEQGYNNADEVLDRVTNIYLNYGDNYAGKQGTSGFIPRYVYTEKGIIDMKHFFANANARQDYPGIALLAEGYRIEINQLRGEPDSAFSYEDLFSNKKGREFGEQFSENNDLKLSQQLNNYFSDIGAQSFPNNVYNSLPINPRNTGGLKSNERRYSSGRGSPRALTWSQMFSRIVRSLFGSRSSTSGSGFSSSSSSSSGGGSG